MVAAVVVAVMVAVYVAVAVAVAVVAVAAPWRSSGGTPPKFRFMGQKVFPLDAICEPAQEAPVTLARRACACRARMDPLVPPETPSTTTSGGVISFRCPLF